MAIVDELVTLLTLKSDSGNDGTSRKLSAGLDKVKNIALAAGAALTVITVAVVAFTDKVAGQVDSGAKFARSIDLGFEALQEFEFGIKAAGGSVGSLRSDFESFASTVGGIRLGQPSEELARLGVSISDAQGNLKGFEELFLDVADGLTKFDTLTGRDLASKLGFGQDTILLLQKGRGNIQALRAEARRLGGVVSTADSTQAAAYNLQLVKMRTALTGLATVVAVSLLPILTPLVDTLTELVVANKEITVSGLATFIQGVVFGFQNFARTVGSLADNLLSVTPNLSGFTDGLFTVDNISRLVTVALLALSTILGVIAVKVLIASAPFLIIVAAITAVILIIEDMVVAFRGGESVTGKAIALMKWYFILLAALVKFSIDKIIDKLKSMGEYLLNLPKLNWSKIIGLDALGAMIDRAVTIVATKWQSLIDGLPIPDFLLSTDTSGNESTGAVGLAAVKPITDIIGLDALSAMIDRAVTLVTTKWQGLIDSLPIPDFLLSAESTDTIGLEPVNPITGNIGSQAARNPSSTQGAVNNTNIVINVSGATSPGRTADIIKRELSLAQSQQVNSPGLNAVVVN